MRAGSTIIDEQRVRWFAMRAHLACLTVLAVATFTPKVVSAQVRTGDSCVVSVPTEGGSFTMNVAVQRVAYLLFRDPLDVDAATARRDVVIERLDNNRWVAITVRSKAADGEVLLYRTSGGLNVAVRLRVVDAADAADVVLCPRIAEFQPHPRPYSIADRTTPCFAFFRDGMTRSESACFATVDTCVRARNDLAQTGFLVGFCGGSSANKTMLARAVNWLLGDQGPPH